MVRQPTPVFLPKRSHGQRSLADYSPWRRKELDATEATEHNDQFYVIVFEIIFLPLLDFK